MAVQITRFVGGLEMDEQALMERLTAILGRSQEAYTRQHQNNDRKRRWVKEHVTPAFHLLVRTLQNIGLEGVSKAWAEVDGWVQFKHNGNDFKYTIRLAISPKGITGTVEFKMPHETYTSDPIENIVEWTQDTIIDNFVQLLGTWHPEEK
jgi:hypothetical protein